MGCKKIAIILSITIVLALSTLYINIDSKKNKYEEHGIVPQKTEHVTASQKENPLPLSSGDVIIEKFKQNKSSTSRFLQKNTDKSNKVSRNRNQDLFLRWDLDLDSIKRLLERGVDINKKDEKGMTPLAYLFLETDEFDRNKIESLVELGASLDLNTNRNLDMLNMALSNKNSKVKKQLIEYLKEKGISFDTSDNPTKYLISTNRLIKNSEYLDEIIYNIKDVNTRLPYNNNNVNGDNAFAYMLYMQFDNKYIQYFLDNGVDVTADIDGPYTILHSCVKHGELAPEIIKQIINQGADVNAGTKKVHATPLMAAAYTGDIRMAKILLEYGADIYLTDVHGRDVFYYANLMPDSKKKAEMIKFLKDSQEKY